MTNSATISVDKLLIFGGNYSNYEATLRLFEFANELGFSNNEMLCTGDLVAYCGAPEKTINLIRDANIPVVKGNCEESLGLGSTDCGCGFDEGSLCNVLSAQWYTFCQKTISDENKQWMLSLPDHVIVHIGKRKLLAVHGSPDSINEFIFPSTWDLNKQFILDKITQDNYDGVIGGHSGIPFAKLHNNLLWLNSGALGMPANDGTARVWCALLKVKNQGISVQIIPLLYNHKQTSETMRMAGLNNGYLKCLSSGKWPSTDILPAYEKQQTGIPLKTINLYWT